MADWELTDDHTESTAVAIHRDEKTGESHSVAVEVGNDGKVARLEVSGPNVTGELIRSIPVGRLSLAARLGKMQVIRTSETKSVYEFGADELLKRWPRKKDATTAELIAKLYEMAVRRGEPPTQSLAEQLGVAKSTAGRMVSFARDAGALTIDAVSIPGKRKVDNADGKKETRNG